MTPQQLRHFAVKRFNDENVATVCHHELEAELPSAEPLSFDDKWKRTEETHQNQRETAYSKYRKKSRQLDENALVEIERHRSIQDAVRSTGDNVSDQAR
jgi:hypothetical protein